MKLASILYPCLGTLAFCADPALTIYNQNFAVVREILPLDLPAGNSPVRFSGVTSQVEPDSVILRDPAGRQPLRVVEQSYRNDPLSQQRLLDLFEGQAIEFVTWDQRVVRGKIVRSGYTSAAPAILQPAMLQPVIEVDGQLQFSLPGQPMFPSLGDNTILQPAFDWILYSAQPARFDAELSYVTGGLSWSSDYNIVAPDSGDTVDIVGWVTLENHSGKQFDHARIKLIAGDVNKLQPLFAMTAGKALLDDADTGADLTEVTERPFEDFHLYALPQPATLHDRETKQVQFLAAAGVRTRRLYVYDGALVSGPFPDSADYGTQCNRNVWILLEFSNSQENRLGIPLPKGRVRLYRRDRDGQLVFTGENEIDHTPKDEAVRLYTGNAFDITGERRQTRFQSQLQPGGWLEEAFEIKLRNHKDEAASVRVVEHLYRGVNWEITQESAAHREVDSKTIEYEVTLQPGEEKALTYTAHYTR